MNKFYLKDIGGSWEMWGKNLIDLLCFLGFLDIFLVIIEILKI